MLKRLFDLYVAMLLLIVTAPVMLVIALLIRLESPGPSVYASPRLGRQGRRFGMLRFRTVDLSRPEYLTMNERLTHVGRFIRNYSLDDLPNLFNILKGDLSIVGPRPTEPARIDLADPVWQQILTVRPGVISPAILWLASSYNVSSSQLKHQLELEYVRKRTFYFDVQLFWQAIAAMIASRGNIKARGTMQIDADWRRYEGRNIRAAGEEEDRSISSASVVSEWSKPDFDDVAQYLHDHGRNWPIDELQFCLVPCGDGGRKPAVFLKVGDGEAAWWSTAELRAVDWLMVSTNRYTCLGFAAHFANTTDPTSQPSQSTYQLVLDVAASDLEAWFTTWLTMPGDAMLFIIRPDLEVIHNQPLTSQIDGQNLSEQKVVARQCWAETRLRLEDTRQSLDNFVDERALLLHNLSRTTNA